MVRKSSFQFLCHFNFFHMMIRFNFFQFFLNLVVLSIKYIRNLPKYPRDFIKGIIRINAFGSLVILLEILFVVGRIGHDVFRAPVVDVLFILFITHRHSTIILYFIFKYIFLNMFLTRALA